MTIRKMVNMAIDRNLETKHIDISIGGTASASASYNVDFITNGNFPVGNTVTTRIGNRIKVLGIHYIVEVQPGDNENVFRLLMVQQRNGGLVNTGVVINNLRGPVETDKWKVRRDVIGEVRYAPVNGSTADTVGVSKFYRGYLKLNRFIEFDPSGGAAPVKGPALGMQFHSDSTVVPHPGIYGVVRVYYKDA